MNSSAANTNTNTNTKKRPPAAHKHMGDKHYGRNV